MQFGGLPDDKRMAMEMGMKRYREFIRKQKEQENNWLAEDPRSDQEKSMANQLYEKVLFLFV